MLTLALDGGGAKVHLCNGTATQPPPGQVQQAVLQVTLVTKQYGVVSPTCDSKQQPPRL